MSRWRSFDDAVPVDVEEVETGRGAPVAEQARLDVVERERALKQRIVFEVDLADGEVVGGAPVGVDFLELIGGEGALGRWSRCVLFRSRLCDLAVIGAPRGGSVVTVQASSRMLKAG